MKRKELTKTFIMTLNLKNLRFLSFLQKNFIFVRVNPSTARAVHTRFLHFLLGYYISAFKHVKDKKYH